MSTNFSPSRAFHPPFNASIAYFFSACHSSVGSIAAYTTYTLINVVLLPLYVFILSTGVRRWRRQCSAAARETMSHSDFFTYNMAVFEIINVFGSILFTLSNFHGNEALALAGILLFSVCFPAAAVFHVLTCVDRYLAVVFPIKYMQLSRRHGIWIRNICSVLVWMKSLCWVGTMELYLPNFPIALFLSSLAVCIFVILFCCLSALWVLTRKRPREMGRNQGKVDPTKQRAFNMILFILVALILRFLGLILCLGLESLISVHSEYSCVLTDSSICLTVPSSLVLPLLFLHRTGKLSVCRKNSG
ncbi:lysophosphatidic acid receptor 6-like [Oryzias latipes]|uniref:lysophosphatidic acid receptor 6-like n=1 Tax=Oryzias latipes TaxID=8090 RepID=UPI0005CB99CE|nr:lysophosphatidic acid receptor 6-like [Oryzias latipes]